MGLRAPPEPLAPWEPPELLALPPLWEPSGLRALLMLPVPALASESFEPLYRPLFFYWALPPSQPSCYQRV